MSLTLGNWIFIAVIIVIGLIMTIGQDEKSYSIIFGLITISTVIAFIFGFNWYNTSTASGIRNYKDYQSNMDNGIDRTIDIYAEDGREIFHYEGKCDVEDNENYILFENQEGKRVIIYYGITDTVIIQEK